MNTQSLMVTVAVLGGTGREGSALARRWAQNGYHVVLGSRDATKAEAAAAEMNTGLGADVVRGADNATAAAMGNIVVLSVPYDAHKATLEDVRAHLDGKVLIDITVPTPYGQPAVVPPGHSAAQEAQALLGPMVRVSSAFQNVSAAKIKNPDALVECDVLVCADDDEAKRETLALVQAAGLRGLDAGPLANAVAAEALTAVLAFINKRYGVKGAGVRITGVAEA